MREDSHSTQSVNYLPSILGAEGCDSITCPRPLIKGKLPVPQCTLLSSYFSEYLWPSSSPQWWRKVDPPQGTAVVSQPSWGRSTRHKGTGWPQYWVQFLRNRYNVGWRFRVVNSLSQCQECQDCWPSGITLLIHPVHYQVHLPQKDYILALVPWLW